MFNSKIIFIGAEKTSLKYIKQIIDSLPNHFDFSILICIPYIQTMNINFINYFSKDSHHIIKHPEHDEFLENGKIYIAPPSAHTFISNNETFHLSREYTKFYTQPSIDLCLLSFTEYYKENLTAIIFPGNTKDGFFGVKKLKSCNGNIFIHNNTDFKTICDCKCFSEIVGSDNCYEIDQIINVIAKTNQYAEY